MKKSVLVIAALTLVLGLAACGGSGSAASGTEAAAETAAAEAGSGEASAEKSPAKAASGGEAKEDSSGKKEIVYGKSPGPYTELFEAAVVPILEKEGYTLKEVTFSNLQTADVALNDGDVDVSVDQHSAYAASFNESYGGDLVPIGPIPTVPAGVYSAKYDSIEKIFDGAKVAVPNDASNTARCYLMLQKIGWIKLADDIDLTKASQDDIVENPYNIEFTEMDSLTIPAAMQDFDFVAITGSVVYNAGIDASTALANEDIQDHLVLQVVVKEENKDADWAQAIVDAYHSDEFKQYLKENNDGLWWVPDELK